MGEPMRPDEAVTVLRNLLAIAEIETLSGPSLDNDPINAAVLAGITALQQLQAAQEQVARLQEQIRQEPCEDCYERCCGAGDQCPCHMRPWDALDQARDQARERTDG